MATEKNSTAKSGKSPPPPPPALVKKRIQNVELEYRYLKTVHSLHKLDDLCFKNCCKSEKAKGRPGFMSIILHCTRRAMKTGMCQFALMVQRTTKGGNEFHVYANSQHNHHVKPEGERAVFRMPKRVLVSDTGPPASLTTPDSRKWTLLGTAKDLKEVDKFRLKHHCHRQKEGNRISMQCNIRKCQFRLLALKTDRGRYHLYANDQHTCSHANAKNAAVGTNSVKARIEDVEEQAEEVQDEEEEQMDVTEDFEEQQEGGEQMEEQEEEETAAEEAGSLANDSGDDVGTVQWWPIEEIQRRLARALRKGRADRVDKWMVRTGPDRIGALLLTFDFMDIVKMLQMAKQQIREGRSNEKCISDWLAWIETALRANQSALCIQLSENTQFIKMVGDLRDMVQGTTSSAAAQQNC